MILQARLSSHPQFAFTMTDITLVYWYAPAVAVLVVLLVVFVAIPRSQRRLEQARRAAYTRHIDLLGDATGDEEDEALRESLNGDDIAEPEFELTTEQIAVEPRDFLDPDLFDPKTTVGVAEVLSLKGHSNSQVPLFLIVPGNPGLVGFYRLFMHHLNRLGRGRVEVRELHTRVARQPVGTGPDATRSLTSMRASFLLSLCLSFAACRTWVTRSRT